MKRILVVFCFIFALISSSNAMAAEPVTVVLKSGQIFRLSDGYRDLALAMKTTAGSTSKTRVIDLSIGGEPFVIDLNEIVLVCRNDCKPLTVVDSKTSERRSAS
jgi:hypothetical protein